MMIYVGSPSSVQRDQATCVDGATKYVFGNKITLVPGNNLFFDWVLSSMSACAQFIKPVMVGVVP